MLSRKLLIVCSKWWASSVKLLLIGETRLKGAVHNNDLLNYNNMYASEYSDYDNRPGISHLSLAGLRIGGRNDRSRDNNPLLNPRAKEDADCGNVISGYGGYRYGYFDHGCRQRFLEIMWTFWCQHKSGQ